MCPLNLTQRVWKHFFYILHYKSVWRLSPHCLGSLWDQNTIKGFFGLYSFDPLCFKYTLLHSMLSLFEIKSQCHLISTFLEKQRQCFMDVDTVTSHPFIFLTADIQATRIKGAISELFHHCYTTFEFAPSFPHPWNKMLCIGQVPYNITIVDHK